jgi:hypothetical protein
MWLPVQDSSFETMKEEPYEKTYKTGKKSIDACDMSDINKAIMRCLVKNIAMFGLGLNVYQGEDIPDVNDSTIVQKAANCEICGKQIVGVGKYTADMIAKRSMASFGKTMCYDCSLKASKAKKEETETEQKGE